MLHTLTPILLDGGIATRLLDVIAVAAVSFILLMWFFNLGNKAFVNLRAQDEHVVMALGLGGIAAGFWFPAFWWVGLIGAAVFLYGSYARFTDRADISEVV